MKKPKLLEQLRREIRRRNYSYRTEQAYVRWIVQFIHFHGTVHPLGRVDIQPVHVDVRVIRCRSRRFLQINVVHWPKKVTQRCA